MYIEAANNLVMEVVSFLQPEPVFLSYLLDFELLPAHGKENNGKELSGAAG